MYSNLTTDNTAEVTVAYSEWGKRVRAGALLADRSIDDVATALGISSKSLHRTIHGRRKPQLSETVEVARLLGLPMSFFDTNVSPAAATTSLGALVADLLDRVKALRRALDEEEGRLDELLRRERESEKVT